MFATPGSRPARRVVAACVSAAALVASVLVVRAASAACLPPGPIAICEDPITGKAPQAKVVGGTILPLPGGGFRIDAKGDRITIDLGQTVKAGTVRFSISNVSKANLNEDTHILMLVADTPELKPAPKNLLELKIWGTKVDPAQGGNTRMGAGDGTNEATKSAGILAWDAAQTYDIDVSWDNGTQKLKLVRSGQTLLDFKTSDVMPGPNNPPVDMTYRYVHLALPYMSNPAFWPVLKSVYGMFSVVATPLAAPDGGAGGSDAGAGGTDAAADAKGGGGSGGGSGGGGAGAAGGGGAGAGGGGGAAWPDGGVGGAAGKGGTIGFAGSSGANAAPGDGGESAGCACAAVARRGGTGSSGAAVGLGLGLGLGYRRRASRRRGPQGNGRIVSASG